MLRGGCCGWLTTEGADVGGTCCDDGGGCCGITFDGGGVGLGGIPRGGALGGCCEDAAKDNSPGGGPPVGGGGVGIGAGFLTPFPLVGVSLTPSAETFDLFCVSFIFGSAFGTMGVVGAGGSMSIGSGSVLLPDSCGGLAGGGIVTTPVIVGVDDVKDDGGRPAGVGSFFVSAPPGAAGAAGVPAAAAAAAAEGPPTVGSLFMTAFGSSNRR